MFTLDDTLHDESQDSEPVAASGVAGHANRGQGGVGHSVVQHDWRQNNQSLS